MAVPSKRELQRQRRFVWEREQTAMPESQPFKNHYNASLMRDLADRIADVYPTFPTEQAVAKVQAQVEALELKGRVALIAEALRDGLPSHYPEALSILLQVVGPELAGDGGMFDEGWWLMPIGYFVEVYGVEDWGPSLEAIYIITQRYTGEFAIRPYLERYPEETLSRLHQWTQDPSAHVRRLVSEGTRTRLPWGKRLGQFVRDPEPVIALLEKLKDDPSPYVRKSIANNLNDIAKDHPQRVLALLAEWQTGAGERRQWIVKHALRTLVKQGHPQALALLGYSDAVPEVERFEIVPHRVREGESVTLLLGLRNPTDESLPAIVDYRVQYPTASGRGSAKVFKWTICTLGPGETITFSKKHAVRSTTTRTLHPGLHVAAVQVNGAIVAEDGF
jgi:3-methyladenine DNA glycosylase AlkC